WPSPPSSARNSPPLRPRRRRLSKARARTARRPCAPVSISRPVVCSRTHTMRRSPIAEAVRIETGPGRLGPLGRGPAGGGGVADRSRSQRLQYAERRRLARSREGEAERARAHDLAG